MALSERPVFDVVIPAYNRAGTIASALRSVFAQDYDGCRIIVVDDGSTDDTMDVVKATAPGAQLIEQENQGASAARNAGVRASTSRWVAFLDSDDAWCVGHLDRMAAAIVATQGAGHYYFADTIPDWETGNRTLWELAGFEFAGPHQLTRNAAVWAMLPLQPMMLQSSVVDRERFFEAGGLKPELRCRHDTHLFLLMSLGHPACAVAGTGVQMGAEDRTGNRLTSAFGPGTESYAMETLTLYSDLLARGYPFEPAQRADLRSRIAAAHLQLSRYARSEGRYLAGLAHLARAAVRHPGRFLAGAGRQVQRVLHRQPLRKG